MLQGGQDGRKECLCGGEVRAMASEVPVLSRHIRALSQPQDSVGGPSITRILKCHSHYLPNHEEMDTISLVIPGISHCPHNSRSARIYLGFQPQKPIPNNSRSKSSALSVWIKTLKIAKEVPGIMPPKAVFGSASILARIRVESLSRLLSVGCRLKWL